MKTSFNVSNYGEYADIINGQSIHIDTKDINIDNLNYNIDCVLNIFRDGIEQDIIHRSKVYIKFADNEEVYMSLFDYYINLIMWKSILSVGELIESRHIFFAQNITKDEVKNYFDTHIVRPYKDKISNRILNNILADTLDEYKTVDEFSLYLANTINVEDDIQLMNENPRARELYNTSLEGVPFEDVKRIGMEKVDELSDMIRNSKTHALGEYFRSGEGINPKQYREYAINIGTKPDGQGQIFPVMIDSSYLNGGLNSVEYMFVESSAGRTAQIFAKVNVGDSGHFARLLGLNNSDTILHHDPNYVCDSVNFQEVHIKNKGMFIDLLDRYYRLHPNGMEMIITEADTHLIGSKIYLRSPITCMSNARGHGVCYRCYGKLAYTNADINIGKMAAEIISSMLTQRMLSAKHLLESSIKRVIWTPGFNEFFVVDANIVYLKPDINIKGYRMRIDPNNIVTEDEIDDYEFNEYIDSFEILGRNENEVLTITTEQARKLFISMDINNMIRKHAMAVDDMIEIQLEDLEDIPLFILEMYNSELSDTLDRIKGIIDIVKITTSYDRHQLLQELVEAMKQGGIYISSVHAEIILSNQIASAENILEKPAWNVYNPDYVVETMSRALDNNPSIIVSLSYQDVNKVLYNPLTYKKNGLSFMDLFFMESPRKYLSSDPNIKYIGNNIIEND